MRKQVQYRLLVVRLGAMGDILHALAAVSALRKAHPAWVIDWAVDPRWRPLLSAEQQGNENLDSDSFIRSSARPLVDRIHLVPAREWGRRSFSPGTWAAIRTLRFELKAANYDAVLDLQGSIRSAVVARMAGCSRVIGEAKPRETPARWFFSERVRTTGEHVIQQDMELASAVAGDLLPATSAALPLDPEAEYWCDQHEDVRRAEWTGKPIILIHPGAGWGAKRWPAERYAVVAAEFARRGAVVLVNAGPGEDAIAATVGGVDAAGNPLEGSPSAALAASANRVTIVRSSLTELIALTRRVTLVIGGDTGPVHLASALGKPVVGIYGPTDPKRNGPYGNASRVLRNPESRSDYSHREPPEAGLLTIAPDAVTAAAVELMLATRQTATSKAVPMVEDEPAEHPAWQPEPRLHSAGSDSKTAFTIEARKDTKPRKRIDGSE